jgi:hypothetical protein
LRCRVVSAKGASCPGPVSGYQPAGTTNDRPIVLSVYREPCNRLTTDCHPSFGVGAYPVQNSSRCLETREVGGAIRNCPLRSTHIPALPLNSAVAPSGCCTSNDLAGHPARMLTPRVARAAHWRSLNQDVPTSDVLCRLTGTTRRLQATSSLPLPALLVLRQGDREPRIHLLGQDRFAPSP